MKLASAVDRLPAPLQRAFMLSSSAIARFGQHRASLSAGGLAYFVALAIGPAAVAVGAIAGLLLTPEQVRKVGLALAGTIPGLGTDASQVADALINLASGASARAVTFTSAAALMVAVYAASKVFYGLTLALDEAFDAPPGRRSLAARLAAAVVALVVLVAGVALLVLLTFLPRILQGLGLGDLRATTGFAPLDWAILLLAIWLVVWAAMRWLPEGGTRVRPLAPGVLFASVWVLAVSLGVGLYASLSSSLGVAVAVFGAPVVILLWLYLSFTGLLLGAELEGSGAEPARRPEQQGDDAGGHRAADPG